MSAPDLLRLARDVAAEAGALVQRMRVQGVGVADTKSSEVDVVTAADRAAEQLIRAGLLAARPDDAIMGEEGADHPGTSGVRWIVDPIDGTVNYLYGIDQYAVSVAAEVDGEVVAGVVLNPATGEEFTATSGGGAHRNGEPIAVRTAASLAVTLVSTGFNYDADLRRRQGAAVARMLGEVRDIRREGSCALDLCSLAMGRTDAFVEEGVNRWDHAAGGLIATEAGAHVGVERLASGRTLLTAAPTASYSSFRDLLQRCGFDD